MKALIKIGDRCNQACRFCHRGASAHGDVPRARVEALIDRAAALAHRAVVLSGGEPTLRPELPTWAARAAARGLEFGLVTNGAALDAGLVRALVRHGLRYAHVSLHGGSAEVHDGLARARSFDRALAGLRALDGRGVEVWVNCVVTRPNLDGLRDVAAAVAPLRDAGLKYSFVDPRGAAAREVELVPAVTEAAAKVVDAIAHARALLGPDRGVQHDGFPLCLLPGLEELRGDLRAHGFATMAEIGEHDLHPVDDGNAIHPAACRPCALRGRCTGLFRNYLARCGDGEVRPVTDRHRPALIEYTHEAQVPAAGEGCPVEALGLDPWDRVRHLFVRHGGRVARFRASTRDYCDEELAELKLRAGRLHVEVPGPGASPGGGRQLHRLRRVARCEACAREPRCAGLHELSGDAGETAEVGLSAILAGVAGDVLEVGGGGDPRRAAAAPAAGEGRVRYRAVVADLARAGRLRAEFPWARPLVGTAETLPLRARSVDHVLLLHGWNALRDPAAGAARLLEAIRPGGTLTVVDTVAVGVARGRARAAGTAPAAGDRPRLRNDGAAEAHGTVAAAARRWSLLDRQDVAARAGGEWLLRYRVH